MKKSNKCFILLFFLILPLVQAHSTPLSYFPEPGSVISELPNFLSISFSEKIDPKVSTIKVYGPNGEDLSLAYESVDKAFKVNLQNGGEGLYTAVWTMVSALDGHFSKGEYTFLVSRNPVTLSSVQSQIQVQHLTTLPEAFAIGLEMLGLALILAAVISIAWFGRKKWKNKKWFFLLGTKLAVLGGLVFIIIKTLDLQQIHSTKFLTTLFTYLGTTAGSHAAARVVIFVIVGYLLVKRKKHYKAIVFLLLLIALLSRSMISHAATSFQPAISVLITMIHLTSKLLWVGLLLAAVTVLLREEEKFRLLSRKIASKLNFIFCIAGISGLYIVWLHLKTTSNIHTEWGIRFFVLALLGLIFALVRLRHYYLNNKPNSELKIRESLTIEFLLGVSLIFVSAYLLITSPPLLAENYDYKQTKMQNGVTTILQPHPHWSDKMLITIKDPEQSPTFVDYEVPIELSFENHFNRPDLQQVSRNQFVFSKKHFVTPGTWTVKISGAEFQVNTEEIKPSQTFTRSNEFTTALSVLAILIAIVCILINKQKKIRFEDKPQKSLPAFRRVNIIVFYTLIILFILLLYLAFRPEFQSICQKQGDFWVQSVPMSNGVVLSPNTVTGCTTYVGLYHFSSFEEYIHFLKPTESDIAMGSPEIVQPNVPIELTFTITENGEPAKDITIEHDRIMHVIIISEDFSYFKHTHAEDTQGLTKAMLENAAFSVTNTFPKAGRYTVLVDYVLKSQTFREQFFVNIEGTNNPTKINPPQNYLDQTKRFGEYEVRFTNKNKRLQENKPARFQYEVYKNGKPVKDLEPYLAATAHTTIVKEDLSEYLHTHGEIYLPGSLYFQKLVQNYVNYHSHFVPKRFGPKIEVPITFAKGGDYKIFTEIKHEGQTILTDFDVHVDGKFDYRE